MEIRKVLLSFSKYLKDVELLPYTYIELLDQFNYKI